MTYLLSYKATFLFLFFAFLKGNGRRNEAGDDNVNTGKPRRNHGEGRRVPPAGRLQRGRRGTPHGPYWAGLAHPFPVHGPVPLFPSRCLPFGPPQPGPCHSLRCFPMGRRHFPCCLLIHLLTGTEMEY